MLRKKYNSDDIPRTNVSMTKADLIIVDQFKQIEKLPTRTSAIRKLVDLGIEFYNFKNEVTKNHISKLTN